MAATTAALPFADSTSLAYLGHKVAAFRSQRSLSVTRAQAGSLHRNGDELMVAVTGAPLDPRIFLGYLREKYTDLYRL